MVFGTFDGILEQHLKLFESAREKGDYLIVVIARDENVKKIRGEWPQLSEGKRQKLVQRQKDVSRAVLGYKRNKLKIIKELRPDIVCLDYAQKIDLNELKEGLSDMKVVPQIIRLKEIKDNE